MTRNWLGATGEIMKPRYTDITYGRQDKQLSVQKQSLAPVALAQISEIQLAGGMRLDKWRKSVGISKATAWRWRKEGKLKVVWRYGLPWVTAETIQDFFTDDGTGPHATPRRQTGNLPFHNHSEGLQEKSKRTRPSVHYATVLATVH